MDAASDNLIPLPAPDFWGPLNRRTNVAVQVADGVIASIRSEGFDVRLSGGDLHFSENGKWRLASRDDKQMLKCRIQEGCAALGDVRVGIVAAAWKRLSEHPGLYQRGVTLERDEPVAPTKDDDPPPFCWPADLDAAKPPRPIHPARRVVLAALDVAPRPVGPVDIARACSLRPPNVRHLLGELLKDGDIEKVGYGRYRKASV